MTLPSLQGEQQARNYPAPTRADQETVEEYVAGISQGVKACRERGRHVVPTTAEAGIVFEGETDEAS